MITPGFAHAFKPDPGQSLVWTYVANYRRRRRRRTRSKWLVLWKAIGRVAEPSSGNFGSIPDSTSMTYDVQIGPHAPAPRPRGYRVFLPTGGCGPDRHRPRVFFARPSGPRCPNVPPSPQLLGLATTSPRIRRFSFWLWWLLIGERGSYGVATAIVDLVMGKVDSAVVVASFRGKTAGARLWLAT